MNNLSKREGLFFKAKSLISYFYGIVLWTSLPSYPMHNQENTHGHQPSSTIIHPSLLGLKTLIHNSHLPKHTLHQNPVIHSHKIITSSPSRNIPSGASSPSFLSRSDSMLFGDLIGTDSGVHLNFDIFNVQKEDEEPEPDSLATTHKNNFEKRRDKLYPPPIPLLARTGNLPGHMPWILTRRYEDVRLILTEERVKHHEYFEAERQDGRLILNLVSLDNMVTNCYGARVDQEREEIDEFDFLDDEDDPEEFIQENDSDDDDEYDELWGGFSVPKYRTDGSWVLSGEVRKCLTYAGQTTMSRILSDINDVSNGVNACAQLASSNNPFAFNAPPGTGTVCGVV